MSEPIKINLTSSEEWAARQVSTTMQRAINTTKQAQAVYQKAEKALMDADAARAEFTETVIKAHNLGHLSLGTNPKIQGEPGALVMVWEPESSAQKVVTKAKKKRAAKKKAAKPDEAK